MILGYPLFLGNTHFSTIFQEILMTAMKLRGQRWLWRGGWWLLFLRPATLLIVVVIE